MNKLQAFYRGNRGKGAGFQAALAADEPRLMVYDVIVSSDSDAEWLGGCSAESFVRALQSTSAPRVHVHVNSPGGDASAGMAMATAIRAYPGEVVVHVDGMACSAASHLCGAAPRVVMALGALIMIHKSWTIAVGNSDDMLATAALLEKFDAQQVALFSTKNPDYDWEAALAAETWLDADEAIAIGLATEREAEKPAMAMAFDLTAFANAPDLPQAPAPAAEPEDTPEQIERRRRVARAHELATNP